MGKVSWKGIKTPERALQWKIDVYKMQNNMARGIFAEKRGGVLVERGFLRAGERQKEKRPIFRTLLLFFVVYDVLYSISTGLIPERIQLRF